MQEKKIMEHILGETRGDRPKDTHRKESRGNITSAPKKREGKKKKKKKDGSGSRAEGDLVILLMKL